MKRDSRIRYISVGVAFMIVLSLLVARLFDLQYVHGAEHLAAEQIFARKDIRVTGARGKILDSNGLPLAYNKTSYSVVYTRDPKNNKLPDRTRDSKIILDTYRIVMKNGGKFLSTFAIRKLDDGSYVFFWPGLDPSKSEEDRENYDARVLQWKDNNLIQGNKDFPIKKDATAEEIFNWARGYYGVPEEASYEEAFALLSVWQDVRSTRFQSYVPIKLAQDVNYETVAEVKMNRNVLLGMQVDQASTRVYPNKTMAAHIIGYMNKMLDEPTMKTYQEMGYSSSDLVGVAGIEKTQEFELTGNTSERTGTEYVEVDSYGRVIREMDSAAPKAGNNVMLTIDSNLQKRLEAALEKNIELTRSTQVSAYNANPDKYAEPLMSRKTPDGKPGTINWASVGAAVVMNVQTGDILAMASYPTFDPNLFTGGISKEDYKKLTGDGSNNPLFNNAVSSRGTPGSIFKMATGLAGLMEKQITLDFKLSDQGEFREHFKDPNTKEVGPHCWDSRYWEHKDEDIVKALKDSCNYFFFHTALETEVDKLNFWADQLGLTTKTGVELPNEVSGQVGNQQTLYSKSNMSGVAALVRNKIAAMMKDECVKAGLQYDDGKYIAVALEMMDLVNQNIKNKGPDIRAILKNELKLDASAIAKSNLAGNISIELYQIEWNDGFTIEDGIGQSVTMLTPIGVARYVSALVNGGNVYEARLIKKIIEPDGTERTNPPKLIRNLGADEKYLDAIKQGMAGVVSQEEGGTAAKAFDDFPDKYKHPETGTGYGGKTGTAQVIKAIDLENNSWFVAFAPFNNPEIAIVVYIPHGYQGALSAYTVKQVLQYYFDKKSAVHTAVDMPEFNNLVK